MESLKRKGTVICLSASPLIQKWAGWPMLADPVSERPMEPSEGLPEWNERGRGVNKQESGPLAGPEVPPERRRWPRLVTLSSPSVIVPSVLWAAATHPLPPQRWTNVISIGTLVWL